MHSGFEIPGIQHHQPPENTCSPALLSMNETHILEQIHNLPATQQLFLDQHHFFPQTRPCHQYVSAAAASPVYFPVNFKLGLNETCTRNHHHREYKDEREDGLVRGSEQFEVPEERDTSLGMLHSWQNQQDSSIKQPFWEPLPAEVSNENSEIVNKQDHHKEAPTACLDSKNRVHFSELEAIYKRLGATAHHDPSNQTGPKEISPVPVGLDHGSEASIGEEAMKDAAKRKKRKKKKRKENSYYDVGMNVFFEDLMKQVVDHHENLHKKFTQVIERLDEERRAREEAWRSQELARFEQESAARARDKALAESREAVIVSYLEKITGRTINPPAGLNNPAENGSTSSMDG